MHTTKKARALAIATGIVAAIAALAILLIEPIQTHHWRLEHFLLPAIVAITIAAAHLVGTAWRESRYGAASGFALVFVMGTLLALYSSMGNQKQQSGEKAGAAEAHNQAFEDKRAALQGEEQRRDIAARLLADTRQQLQVDCVRGRKPKAHCDGVRTNIDVYTAAVSGHDSVIERHRRDLEQLGGHRIARPKAEGFAELLELIGFERAKVERAADRLERFGYSMIFEVCSIVAFGYGFGGHRRQPLPRTPDNCATVAQVAVPEERRLPPPKRSRDAPFSRSAAEADLAQLLATGEPVPPQITLAKRWHVHPSTASRWLADLEARQVLHRQVDGRCKVARRPA